VNKKILLSILDTLWAPALTLIIFLIINRQTTDIIALLELDSFLTNAFHNAISCAIWLSAAWLFNRLLTLILWQGIIGSALGRHPPRLVIQLTGLLIFLLTVSGIMRFVFGESITAIWAASGAVGIVVGFALKNLILDTFSGLAIHLERPFEVGDWISCHTRMGTYIGRVEETNWRTTRLWTTTRNIIIIPNSYLTTTLLTNFSMPDSQSRFDIKFTLDFSVTSERVIRILSSAALESTLSSNGILSSPPPKVIVNEVSELGVEYELRYFLDPRNISPAKARSEITQTVLKHIKQAGLTLAYPRQDLFLARMPWRQKDWCFLKDLIHHLQSLSLFINLKESELEFLAQHLSVHSLDKGSIIVKQGEKGDSMFILAEGLLEVLIDQPDGTQLKVADLAPGIFFGEKSLLTGEPRSATVVCVAESEVCEITKSCMAKLLEINPDLVDTLGRAVVERDIINEAALTSVVKQDLDLECNSIVKQMAAKIKHFFGC